MPLIYKHDYHPLSIYGNVVSLLREHVSGSGLHLDIGCGYGAIAEPIRDELGLTYVGFDLADDGLASLGERGFETHSLDLSDIVKCEEILAEAIGNRPVASLSFIDTLEHITNGEEVLSALHRVAAPRGAPLALSVPNVSHKDLALKLLLGRWDVTEDGLLDHTHVTLYNHSRLLQLMKSVGWQKIATRDWPLQYSDQYFPKSNPLLNEYSPIGAFLQQLINRANPHAIVNQFVGIYRPGQPQPRPLLEDRVEPNAPFLSVVVTVTADRAGHLRKLLTDLTNQTSHDFELVFLHTSADPEKEIQTGLLAGLPILRGRTRLIASSGLARPDALNAAIERCSGRYFAILDDAQELDRDWIRGLMALSEQMPGTVLQCHEASSAADGTVNGVDRDRGAVGAVPTLLPTLYRFARAEHGCFATLAIPTSAFHQLGLRFELQLPDGRGWDLAIDAILHCGLSVTRDAAITPLENGDEPVTTNLLGTEDISLLKRLNDRPILLSAGAAERIEVLADAHALLRERLARVEADYAALSERNSGLARLINDRPVLRGLIEAYCPHWDRETSAPEPDAPFLSIITRTQGKRPFTLRDALMSLAGQTSQDFEVVLVVHTDNEPINDAVRDMVGEFPASLQTRINVVTCSRPGRSSPLNDGIAQARGRYIAVLDDDDIALAHWVETFQKLAWEAPPGALLRATCTRQEFDLTNKGDVPAVPRATSWFKVEWPAIYDAVHHIYTNATPPVCIAYPIAVFRDDGLRFDETLSTVEDWDLTTRAAMLRGIATTPEVTAIYRWGAAADVSTIVHPVDEWDTNKHVVHRKLDAGPILLPAGSALRIASLCERGNALEELETRARNLEEQKQQLELCVKRLATHAGNLEETKHHLGVRFRQLEARASKLEEDKHHLEFRIEQLITHGKKLEGNSEQLYQNIYGLGTDTRELEARNQCTGTYLAASAAGESSSVDDSKLAELSRDILVDLVSSSSWRLTRPLRGLAGWFAKGQESDLTIDTIPPSAAERQHLIQKMRLSTSWRITFPIRVVGRLGRRTGLIGPRAGHRSQ